MTGEVKTLQFAEGTSLTGAPTTFFLNTSGLLTYANDAAFVSAKGTAAANGDAYKNTTDGYIHFYDTAWRIVDSRKINATTADPGVNDDNTSGYEVNSKWINTTTGKYFIAKSVGTGAASWIELVDIASTQTISGVKTYTETSTHDKELILKSISTPSSPAASYLKLYNKSDSLYYKNSGGTETQIATGSGQIFVPSQALNYSIHCSVGSNALTITVKGGDGNDLSGSNTFRCFFRNSTIATGTWTSVDATSNLSLTISSGSTLGHGNNREQYIYLYAINNAGTIELAVCTVYVQQDGIISTTAEGGAGAADSNRVFYSTTARSNVSFLLLGRIDSTQATAGTWASTPTRITLGQNVEKKIALRYTSNSGQTADSAIEFEDLDYDVANAYNPSNGTFTSPKAMKYRVFFKVRPTSNTDIELYIQKNGSATIYNKTTGSAGAPGCICMDEIDLAPGDTVIASSGTSFTMSSNAGENVLTISEI